MRLIVLLLLQLLFTYIPVKAATDGSLAVMTTDARGQPSAGQAVKVEPVNVHGVAEMIVLRTDENGVADFGNVPDGEYTVEACDQSFVFASSSDSTGWLLAVTCEYRALLPTAFR